MGSEQERHILQQIRKRALRRCDDLERQSRLTQAISHTLDALHDVTELPRTELEMIAAEVSASMDAEADNFFSIKNQLLMVSAAFGVTAIVIWGLLGWMA